MPKPIKKIKVIKPESGTPALKPPEMRKVGAGAVVKFGWLFPRLSAVFSSLSERNAFFQNLSLLIGSGTPLVEALRIISQEKSSWRMTHAIKDILETVESGGKFWEALQKHDYLFTAYEIRMMKIAEETGNLEKSLDYLSKQLEKDADLRGKISSALFYPTIVLSFAAIIGLGVSWFVLPRLSRAFASLRVALPAPTKLLIGMGDLVNNYGSIIFPVFIALVFILALLIRLTRLRFAMLGLLEFLPGIGQFLREVRTARLSLFLGTLLDSGVPLVEGLETMEKIVEFKKERRFFAGLRERIEAGDSFENSFKALPGVASMFPPVTQQMIFVAERSGKLPEVFLYVSNLYEKRVETGSKNLTQTLEPILLVGIAGVVAFIAIAIILPIYSLLGGLQGGAPPPRPAPPPAVEEALPAAPVAPAVQKSLPSETSIVPKETESAPPPAEVSRLRVKETPLGYLNVRAGPGTEYKLLREAAPGEEFAYTTFEVGWYRIVDSDGRAGWVAEKYVELIK
jgi:type IV pilus assembly protein PilC